MDTARARVASAPQSQWEFSAKTPYMLLRGREGRDGKGRIAVVIAKAAQKSAVKRNFLRREAKAVLSAERSPRTDLLLTLSPSAARLSKKTFRNEVLKVLRALTRK